MRIIEGGKPDGDLAQRPELVSVVAVESEAVAGDAVTGVSKLHRVLLARVLLSGSRRCPHGRPRRLSGGRGDGGLPVAGSPVAVVIADERIPFLELRLA